MTFLSDPVSDPVTTTAPYVRRPSDPDASTWYVAHRFTFLAESSDTGGALTVLDTVVRRGFEPPPHTHTCDDEGFLMIEGSARFRSGDRWMEAQPGSFVWLPRGLEHGFELETDTARMVIVVTPGGIERGFRAMSRPADSLDLPSAPQGPPSTEQIGALIATMQEVGVRFAPPPQR